MTNYVPTGARLTAKKRREANALGYATAIGALVVLTQVLFLKFVVPSLTLKAEMYHSAMDLLVNMGAFWVAVHIITKSEGYSERAEKIFMYLGLIILVFGTIWTAQEAVLKIGVPSELAGEWLIIVGLIGGIGNFFAHKVLADIHHHDRSHKHKLVHLHIIEDMILAGVVIVSGAASIAFGWNSLDTYLSLLAVVWVLRRAYVIFKNLKQGRHAHCDHKH